MLIAKIKKLAELDPTNCQVGPPVRLSTADPSLTINLDEEPNENTWSIVKKAIILNAQARRWSYSSGIIQEPVKGFTASMSIPNTIYFAATASRFPEGYCLLYVYVTLLERLEENET